MAVKNLLYDRKDLTNGYIEIPGFIKVDLPFWIGLSDMFLYYRYKVLVARVTSECTVVLPVLLAPVIDHN
jgi:hypothetical protein